MTPAEQLVVEVEDYLAGQETTSAPPSNPFMKGLLLGLLVCAPWWAGVVLWAVSS